MADEVQVYNAALAMVGVASISDERSGQAGAVVCRQWYPAALRHTQTTVPWLQAHRKVELAESAVTDPLANTQTMVENTYLYDLPADFLQLWTWAGSVTPADVQREGNMLRSACVPPMPLSYMRALSLEEADARFVELLELRLAEYVKPRFSKENVSGDSLTLQTIMGMRRSREAEVRTEELSQMAQDGAGFRWSGAGFPIIRRPLGDGYAERYGLRARPGRYPAR